MGFAFLEPIFRPILRNQLKMIFEIWVDLFKLAESLTIAMFAAYPTALQTFALNTTFNFAIRVATSLSAWAAAL